MRLFSLLYALLRHLNETQRWDDLINYVGTTNLHVILFAIIFIETGLVVWPFLPGDSLLFAVGTICATSSTMHLPVVAVLLCVAANCGDIVNYCIGYRLGPKVFSKEGSRLLNKKHLLEAQQFYEKHGRKTIIIARFIPIIRTFAPFVAGIGRMPFLRFIAYSVAGGVLWVLTCLFAGYRLAKVEFVKNHFEIVVLAIIAVSLLPVVISFLNSRRAGKKVLVREEAGARSSVSAGEGGFAAETQRTPRE